MIKALPESGKHLQEGQDSRDALQVVTLRLPGTLIVELDRVAGERGYSSRSELVRQLLVLSLSGRTLEFQRIQEAAEELFLPISSRLSELMEEILKEIPRQKLLELAALALIPFAQFISGFMGIPAAQIEKELREPLAEIIGEPDQ